MRGKTENKTSISKLCVSSAAYTHEPFNSGVKYNGRALKWDRVIERKAAEIGLFLTGKSRTIEFDDPAPTLSRVDCQELRKRILTLSQSEARGLRIGKSTLHYLRKNARYRNSFKVHESVRRRLSLGS